MMNFPWRSRDVLRTRSGGRQGIAYWGPEKEKKAPVVGPILKNWVHCFNADSCDISGREAVRRSQNVDREIRALWGALARQRTGRARPADGYIGDPERRRPVRFLAAGGCYCRHQDRVFFAGAVVCDPRHVGPDPQRAAISARPLGSSVNLTWSARALAALSQRFDPLLGPLSGALLGRQTSPSCFAKCSVDAAAIRADRIRAGART